MQLVGRLWADDNIEEEEEEEQFTHILSKSQKKKLRKKGISERTHYTRRGGHSKTVQ